MFVYYIYVGTFNETFVETKREKAVERLNSRSARIVSIDMIGRPTGLSYSKLPQ